MVRHSHQDALHDQTFQRLLAAAHDLDHPYDAECAFILVAGGRLGMRIPEKRIGILKANYPVST